MAYSRTGSGHKAQKNEAKRLDQWFATIEAQDYQGVKNFLEAGQAIHVTNKVNFSSIFIMVDMGWIEGLELLGQYAKPGDFDRPRAIGLTPLELTIIYKDPLMVKTLVNLGADVFKRTQEDQSLLHLAMEYHYDFRDADENVQELMEFLIEMGCSANEPNHEGVSFMDSLMEYSGKYPQEMEFWQSTIRLVQSKMQQNTLDQQTPQVPKSLIRHRL